MNADASLVGFYTSCNNGQHLAMSGFVEALLGAQMSGGGIGSGAAKAVPVGRNAPVKAPLASGTGTKSGKGIALVFGKFNSKCYWIQLWRGKETDYMVLYFI